MVIWQLLCVIRLIIDHRFLSAESSKELHVCAGSVLAAIYVFAASSVLATGSMLAASFVLAAASVLESSLVSSAGFVSSYEVVYI